MKPLYSERGLTLIELLLVAGLLAMLSTIVYSSMNGILSGKALIENQRYTHRSARFVLQRLSKEVSSAAPVTLTSIISKTKSPTYVDLENNERGATDLDSLHFATASGAQAVFDSPGNFGFIEVRYYLEPDEDAKRQFSSTEKRYVLLREELPAGNVSDEVREQRKIVTPLARNIVGFNIRLYQKKEWTIDWKPSTTLPEAIEVTLRIMSDQGAIDTFKTAIATPQAMKAKGSK